MAFLRGVLAFAAFIGCIALVIVGQQHRGLPWIGVMLLGLAGLLILLYLYNRRYTRADKKTKQNRG